jgi:gamma-glutamylcyclotransferase (GGCT)/AIG2-like uncharacterized protein YtfP
MPHPQELSRHVFVYGTLRKGDDNDITRLQPPAQFIGTAWIQGTMYHLGAYPGVLLGGSNRVQGEVYAISADLEQVLDRIEGLSLQSTDEYAKRHINVAVAGLLLNCVVYEINPDRVQGHSVVISGDWCADR